MRKRLIAAIAAVMLAAPLGGCSFTEKTQPSVYTITAALSGDNVLTASTVCDYVNNTDVPLKEIWFNLYPNAYREGAKYAPISDKRTVDAYPSGKSYSVMTVSKVSVNGAETDISISGDDENVLVVPLAKALEPTDKASIAIDYTIKLPKVRHRLGYTDKAVNLANFYPIACVYRDGGFVASPYYSIGDPFYSECANYSVTLTVPKRLEIASTGTVTEKTSSGDNSVYKLAAENVRDFAAVLGEHKKLSGLSGTTIVNYLYYSDGEPEKALNAAIDAVRIFGEQFGEYPYKEYTVVQTGLLQGGMEYPNLSMISDECTGDGKLDVIVHETAHQWWYGVVGNDEVKYSWLDEALAEYSAMMFYEHANGYKYTFDAKRADALTAYMLYCETYKRNGLDDTSMTRAINEYADETEYSYMIYVKGALMLDDIRNTVGSISFVSGLKRYYTENKFAIAEPQNLIGAMEKTSKRQLKPLFESWLNGNVRLYSTH